MQIVLFVVGRRIRKKARENSIVEKYNIRSRQEAWKLMGDPDLPEEDRKKIEALYHGEEDEG